MTFYFPTLERSRIRFSQLVQPLAQGVSRAVVWVERLVSAYLSGPLFTMQNTNASDSTDKAQPNDERSSDTQPTPNQPTLAQDRWRQALTLILAVTQVVAPGLVIVAKVGTPVGEVSNKFFTAVTPANYAFIIWSLIYPACLAYGVYQALPAQRSNPLLRRIGWWAAAAFLANSLWIPAFQLEQFWLSVLIIGTMMASLVGVLRGFIESRRKLSRAETGLALVPLSVFAGWITAATILNVTVALQASGWGADLLSPSSWGTLVALVVGALGSYVSLKSRVNWGYGLTLVWALVGIIVAQASSSVGVAVACGVSIVAILVSLWRARVSRTSLALKPARV